METKAPRNTGRNDIVAADLSIKQWRLEKDENEWWGRKQNSDIIQHEKM